MKILGITLLILCLLTGLSIGIDLIMGFDLKSSLYHAVSPFIVAETTELTMFVSLILVTAGKPLYSTFAKQK